MSFIANNPIVVELTSLKATNVKPHVGSEKEVREKEVPQNL